MQIGRCHLVQRADMLLALCAQRVDGPHTEAASLGSLKRSFVVHKLGLRVGKAWGREQLSTAYLRLVDFALDRKSVV